MKLYVVQNQLVFLSAPLPQSDEDDFLFMVDFCSEFPDGEDDAVHLGINSEKKVIRVTPGLTYCKSFPQEEYRTFLWNRITDRSNLTVEIRASRNRIFCGDISKSKTVDLEVSVVGGFLWQLWQTHRVEQGGKGECRIKIKLTNIHSLNVGTGQRIGFGGDGKLLKEVSGGKDFKLETDFMKIETQEGATIAGASGMALNPIPWSDEMWNLWNKIHATLCGTLSVSVMFDGFIAIQDAINKKLLLEEVASDAVMVAANGARIKCHKCFLVLRSPVLAALFQSGMEETATNTIVMAGMTEAAVRAFLSYLYTSDTTEAQASCEIALEVFQAGHRYLIPELENAMKNFFLFKSLDFFNVECALRLFLFVRNLEMYSNLKEIAVLILKTNFRELQTSPGYQQLFVEFPQAAMDLCQTSFALNPCV